jgi:hypothetical protein
MISWDDVYKVAATMLPLRTAGVFVRPMVEDLHAKAV